MELVLNTVEIETKQVMENLKVVLETAEMTFNNVVKASIFMINMSDFDRINSELKNIVFKTENHSK